MVESPQVLAGVIADAILLQRADAGDRLCPMRRIATAFQMNMWTVRAAVELLVARDILIKRWGSGVYLRKVPTGLSGRVATALPEGLSLFLKTPERHSRLRAKPGQTALDLGLWWHNRKPGSIDETFLDGAREQAEKMGHRLDVRLSSAKSRIREEFQAYLHQALEGCARDGLLISAKFAETYFAEPLDRRSPVVFSWLGSSETLSPVIQPLVTLDLRAAHRKALAVLAGEGCRRIGLLGLHDQESEFDPALYQNEHLSRDHKLFLDRLQLPSDGLAHFSITDPADARDALLRLLDARPDGLYVADDQLLANLMGAFRELGVVPGENLPLITLSSDAVRLPGGCEWSRMHFNIAQLGRLAIQSLVHTIQSSRMDLLSFTHQPQWIPGRTHGKKSGG